MLVMLVFLSTQAFSQMYVLRGGITSSKWLYSDEVITTSVHPSFNLGGAIEFPINDNFFFEIAAYFEGKGTKVKFTDAQTKSANVHMGYIDVPLRMRFKKDMMLFKVYGSVGPYAGLAVVGEMVTPDGEKSKLEFGKDAKKGDFGVSFGPGVEFNHVFVELAVNIGMANISAVPNMKTKNKSIAISVGYRFGEEY